MPKVKLIGAIRRVNGDFHPYGAVVDVDKDTAERLLENGVAEKVGRGASKADEPVVDPAEVVLEGEPAPAPDESAKADD